MLEFKSVSCSYSGEKEVLHEISFQINNGERVALIGANGAGKSTILKTAVGLMDYSGDVVVGGKLLAKATLADVRRKIGYVMQNSDNQLFMPTVYKDIMFGLLNYGVIKEEAEKSVDEVLTSLGIMNLKMRHNHKLSGGEKKLVAIAVVLALKPDILIMDEPSSTLDPYNRRQLINIINNLNVSKVIATHDLDMVLDTCDRVILLNEGKIVADGDAKGILSDKELMENNRLELPFRYVK